MSGYQIGERLAIAWEKSAGRGLTKVWLLPDGRVRESLAAWRVCLVRGGMHIRPRA